MRDFDSVHARIESSLQSGEALSPFLFFSPSRDLLYAKLDEYIAKLCLQYGLPHTSVIRIDDDAVAIKIEQVRDMLHSATLRPSHGCQIFVIQDIARLTLASSNSMLKFLEEPGAGNLIFLTSDTHAGVLDTILSRVMTVSLRGLHHTGALQNDAFFADLLSRRGQPDGRQALLGYIATHKLEKPEIVTFLSTLLTLRILPPSDMAELQDDLSAVMNNNVNAKYLLDTWILRLLK